MTGVARAATHAVEGRLGAVDIMARPSHRYVARLVLTDFRCYEREVVESDGGVVVLTGPNGAGKTNLLEALSLLAPGDRKSVV